MVEPLNRLEELGRLVDATWQAHPRRAAQLVDVRERIAAHERRGVVQLGELVGDLGEEARAETDALSDVRGRLLRRPAPRRPGIVEIVQRRPFLWLGPAVAAAAAVALVVALQRPQPLVFDVADASSGRSAQGAVGQLLATSQTARRMRFSDGSTVQLHVATKAKVTALASRRTDVVLDRGELDVYVVPGGPRRWTFQAGPFAVRVLGTRFTVAWDPDKERFGLNLVRGRVVIEGPSIGRRDVRAGENVEVWLGAKSPQASAKTDCEVPTPPPVALAKPTHEKPIAAAKTAVARATPSRPQKVVRRHRPARRTKPAVAHALPTADETVVSPPPVVEHPPPPPPVAQPQAAPPSPMKLARDGKHREALSAVDALGWDAWIGAASGRDLLRLADSARFAGDAGRAVQLYTALRKRAPGSNLAAAAAFALGRLAVQRHRDHKVGAAWFARYLAERPSGPLAREASGRLLESLVAMGATSKACRAAEAYMRDHPAGPHMGLAVQTVATCRKSL